MVENRMNFVGYDSYIWYHMRNFDRTTLELLGISEKITQFCYDFDNFRYNGDFHQIDFFERMVAFTFETEVFFW